MRLTIIGFGIVGQSFAKLILDRASELYSVYGVNPRIVACIDTKGVAISPGGLDLRRLLDIKKLKELWDGMIRKDIKLEKVASQSKLIAR